MLAAIRTCLPAHARCYSQALVEPTASASAPKAVRYAYYVRRNSQGSLPVYTDTRMHNKFCTLVRNVEGNVDQLAAELKQTLFEPNSPAAERVRVAAVRNRHVVLTGGHFKKEVLEWLRARGF